MTALITAEYVAQNRAMHRAHHGYGAGGARHVVSVLRLMKAVDARSMLDYGCGQGELSRAIRRSRWPGRVTEYDPAVQAKATAPRPADVVACTDVLEHVEPECLANVLAELKRLTRKAAFLSIATRPSNKTLPDGRNAHLMVRPAAWWLSQLVDLDWPIWGARLGHRKHTFEERGLQVWLAGGA